MTTEQNSLLVFVGLLNRLKSPTILESQVLARWLFPVQEKEKEIEFNSLSIYSTAFCPHTFQSFCICGNWLADTARNTLKKYCKDCQGSYWVRAHKPTRIECLVLLIKENRQIFINDSWIDYAVCTVLWNDFSCIVRKQLGISTNVN